MDFPQPDVRRRVVWLGLLFGAGFFWACRDDTLAPRHGRPDGLTSAALVLDPDPNNPDLGCWVAPDPASWGSGDDGGSPPYNVTRCGIPVSLTWPGFVWQDNFTYTRVRNGNHMWPWLHSPGFLGDFSPEGWPWTITFGSGVKNVRVYTRWAEFAGGTVVLKGSTGAVIATRPIPLSPTYVAGSDPVTYTGIVDTLAFPDSNVWKIEIKPALDPNYPNEPGEYMGWQAQFERNPEILLDCGNFTVTNRHDVRRCVAKSAEAAKPLTITAWSFTSDSGDLIDRPAAEASDSVWQGAVVRTGFVKVQGTIGGQLLSTRVIVEIRPRTWDSTYRADTVNVVDNPGPLTSKPGALGDLGNAVGALIVNQPKVSEWLGSITDGGPNNGWVYMIKVPAKESSLVHVNTAALNDTSAFYRVQYATDKTVKGTKYCGRDWVATKFRPLADAHEGTKPEVQPNSHIGIHRRTVDSLQRPYFEKFAGPQEQNLTAYTTVLDARADRNSAAMDTATALNNINNSSFPCKNFVYVYPPGI